MKKKEQNLMSAYDFAKLKGVSNTIIYRHILHWKEKNLPQIKTITIGKHKYIDANEYAHLEFKQGKS